MSDEAVCRTAPAAPGLLIKSWVAIQQHIPEEFSWKLKDYTCGHLEKMKL